MATFFATEDALVNDEYITISSLPAHVDDELDDHVAENLGAYEDHTNVNSEAYIYGDRLTVDKIQQRHRVDFDPGDRNTHFWSR